MVEDDRATSPDAGTAAPAADPVADAKPKRNVPKYPLGYNPSEHELQIEALFSEPGRTLIADRTPIEVDWSVAVCFVNRSGSNWLADLLAATHKVGRAGEFLNGDVVRRQTEQHGHASFDAYLRELARRTSRGGCFAFKTGILQLHFIRRHRIIPDLLPKTKYVFCRRRDIAAQALSFIKADMTLEWRRVEGQEPVPFDYDTISDARLIGTIRSIAGQYANFEQFFSVFGIDYVPVVYEEFMADTAGELDRIGTALGIKIPNAARIVANAKTSVMQRDEASERRLRRFHRMMGRR